MKASELRIGNWYFNEYTKKNIQVYPQFFSHVAMDQDINEDIEMVSGAALDEQWLLRLGFKKKDDHIFIFPRNTSFRLWGFGWNVEEYQFNKEWMEISTPKIKFVHQLQNLFFALTGKELELDKTSKP